MSWFRKDFFQKSFGRGWMVRAALVAALLALKFFAPHASAQSGAPVFDATELHEPSDLGSAWRVHGGDDAAYARPDFDDAQWTKFDPHTDLKKLFKGSYPDVIWYRLRVKVNAGQTGMAFEEQSISRAFEVYANGERLIAIGQFSPFIPCTWDARELEPIPDRLLTGGWLVIAVRAHISRSEWAGEAPGYDAGNLMLGQRAALYSAKWLEVIGLHSLLWFDRLLLFGVGAVALVLFAAQRRQTEYLWIAALGLLTLCESIEPFIAEFYNIPLRWEVLSDLLRVATPFIWVSLYFSFVHQRMGWRWRAFLVFAGLMNAFSAIQGFYLVLPLWVQFFSNLPFIVLLSLVVPIVLAIHWLRGNREAGILLIPVVLFSVYIYAEIGFETLYQIPSTHLLGLRGLGYIDRYPLGPFSISLDSVSNILSTVALAVIMLLRSTTTSRRQALLEGELAAAQQVQQVLLPEQGERVPGFAVETVYQPAQQVGGDFFQILPAGEGGLLVVVGDVAGKGLPAAMLVSVLVGTIRGVAEYTTDPAELLSSLNERLVGRGGGGFSTALAAHIASSGAVTIANAGHLSPYLDGKEVELAGALPLGVVSGAVYAESHAFLGPGSRLTFYSDGVIEAQNQHGELFGFERAQAISTQPAAAIVEAARKFGQEDDITVVTIARDAAVANAA